MPAALCTKRSVGGSSVGRASSTSPPPNQPPITSVTQWVSRYTVLMPIRIDSTTATATARVRCLVTIQASTPNSTTVLAVCPDGKMSPPSNTACGCTVTCGPSLPTVSLSPPTVTFSSRNASPHLMRGCADLVRLHHQISSGTATAVDGLRWPIITKADTHGCSSGQRALRSKCKKRLSSVSSGEPTITATVSAMYSNSAVPITMRRTDPGLGRYSVNVSNTAAIGPAVTTDLWVGAERRVRYVQITPGVRATLGARSGRSLEPVG